MTFPESLRRGPGRFRLLVGLWALLTFGCETIPPPAMMRLAPSDYPEFRDDLNYEGLSDGIQSSLTYLNRVPASRMFAYGQDAFDAGHLRRSLETFLAFVRTRPDVDALNAFIRDRYRVYRSSGRDGAGEVLYTGYFEPLLEGSRIPSPKYPFPVYGPPEDLAVVDLSAFSDKYKGEKITGRVSGKTFVPYHDRREIDAEDVLAGKAKPLVWVKDRVDLFFLHIQGSGKVALEGGGIVNLHYHSANGRPYRSIGQLLIAENKVSRQEMSMQKIKAYLRDHPAEVDRVLYANPSYIFFSEEAEGPLGALNVALTPGRSVALDRKVFPLSGLVFVETRKPETAADGAGPIVWWTPFSRFALGQDTGGAIRGPGRADFFWGGGPYAEIAAGHMKHTGRLYLLVLEPDSR